MTRGTRLHFSFRSPYTWMAVTKLLRQVPDAHERVELVPYWNPDEQTSAALAAAGADFHYAPMSKAKHLYILHDTRGQAARLGLRMRWPVDDDPWWELPHLGYLVARRSGAGAAFYTAVMSARWQRGADVCDPAVLRGIAEEVGIDGDAVVRAPDSAETRAEGVTCLSAAYHDDIFGVPYFRIGRHRFWGLDRVDDFVAELDGTAVRPTGATSDPGRLADLVGAYDTDTAGGCG